MPTIKEFKFNCPTCGQHMVAETEWSGRRINCPSCDTGITIPSPAQMPEHKTQVLPPTAKTHPTPSGGTVRVAAPAEASQSPVAQAPAQSPSPNTVVSEQPGGAGSEPKPNAVSTGPKQPEHLRVAALTPAIKLDMVRAVRRRITDESSWLPGRIKGANAYAAKVSDGEPVLVDATSSEATRFSLIGAFLLEFHLRSVARTATGRTKFLDREIPDAVREVLFEETGEEEREQTEDPLLSKDMMAIPHSQCLATLDVLEARFSQRMEQARFEKAKRTLGNVRLPDLVGKLEKKTPVAPEEVATALYHELIDLRRRLDRLERRDK
jgi:hypothetical protein